MTRWKKDAREFDVSLYRSGNRDGSESLLCRVPKPIVEMLGEPNSIKFQIRSRGIVVTAGEK